MLLAGVALVALLVATPSIVGAQRSVSPRVSAAGHLVSLIGWGLAPTVLLACLGGAGGCVFGPSLGRWRVVAYLPALAAAAVPVWKGLGLAAAARRAELVGVAKAASVRRRLLSGEEVWVLPSQKMAAYAGGLWRPKAIVTSGLLSCLAAEEQLAVCSHEAAHVRLGHPRLLIAAGAVASAYGSLGPVRRAWRGLRRDLEAAADDEAARVAGPRAVISALARVALLEMASGSPAAFGAAEHLRYRIARLEGGQVAQAGPTAGAASLLAGVISVVAWAVCVLGGVGPSLMGLGVCLGLIASLGLRPTWAWVSGSARRCRAELT